MTDLRKVRSLVEIMKENPGFTEIAVESSEGKIQISREMRAQAVMTQQPILPPAEVVLPKGDMTVTETNNSEQLKGTAVEAPCVGTFYVSSKPGAPAFVKIGDKVKQGQTVCIVEAMKNMNAISAPCDGEVSVIEVENAHPVEFGQVLMRII